jgi:hypothetical protein
MQRVIFGSHLIVGLLPQIKAPKTYKTGISRGKLNGLTTMTGPYGNLYPIDSYP